MTEQKITDIARAKTNFIFFNYQCSWQSRGKIKLSQPTCLTGWYNSQNDHCDEGLQDIPSLPQEIRELNYDVILHPAQHVKSYQWRQKMIITTHTAIAETYQYRTIRLVPIKVWTYRTSGLFENASVDLDGRTQLMNHVLGLLTEYGIVFSKSATELRPKLPALPRMRRCCTCGIGTCQSEQYGSRKNGCVTSLNISRNGQANWIRDLLPGKLI